MSRPTDFLTDSNVPVEWGVRPARDGDDEFLRDIGRPPDAKALRRGEHLKVIEVEGEPTGFVVLRKTGKSVCILDLRLLPHRRWRGIESELLEHLQTWTRRQGLVLARPAKGAFPDAAQVGEIVRLLSGAASGGGKKKDWGPTGRTWFLHILSLIVGAVLLFKLGWITRTALVSDVTWFEPQRLLVGLGMLLFLEFGILGPSLLAEGKGRLFGGRVRADLGAGNRLPWLLATAGFLVAALACVLALGPEMDRGGAFARLFLVPASPAASSP